MANHSTNSKSARLLCSTGQREATGSSCIELSRYLRTETATGSYEQKATPTRLPSREQTFQLQLTTTSARLCMLSPVSALSLRQLRRLLTISLSPSYLRCCSSLGGEE